MIANDQRMEKSHFELRFLQFKTHFWEAWTKVKDIIEYLSTIKINVISQKNQQLRSIEYISNLQSHVILKLSIEYEKWHWLISVSEI